MFSPATLLRFARSSKLIHQVALSYIDHAFNIEARLSRFFSNPISFRTLQARTNTLISGSMALQFFDRSYYNGSDLDIYTSLEHQFEVGDWLIHEGYLFKPSQKQPETFKAAALEIIGGGDTQLYTWRGVGGVFNFIRSSGNSEEKVQMIVATNAPMEVILSFHSTCVMNLISFDTAYSLYPRATFEERRTLICASPGPGQDEALKKYAHRGWGLISELTTGDQFDPHSSFRVGYRWIDDSRSWVIPLDTSQLLLPTNYPLGPTSLTNWQLIYHQGYNCAAIACNVTKESSDLQYRYVITDSRVLTAVQELWKNRVFLPTPPYVCDVEFWEDCRKVARSLAYERAKEDSTFPRF